MKIIIFGNPVDGLSFVGPFETEDEANAYADNADGDWWVADLPEPSYETETSKKLSFAEDVIRIMGDDEWNSDTTQAIAESANRLGIKFTNDDEESEIVATQEVFDPIGKRCWFNYPEEFTSLPDYSKRRGDECLVLRQLTEKECDRSADLERMYLVRFEDWVELHAFESELEPINDN